MDHVEPFQWLFNYVEEATTESSVLLRPVVPIRFSANGVTTDTYEALVDSGAESILTPDWVAMQLGIQPRGREQTVRIGGSRRSVIFEDVGLHITSISGETISWTAEVGFMNWENPPWLVILGQSGFFNQFSVCMSRLSQSVAIQHRDHFEQTYSGEPS